VTEIIEGDVSGLHDIATRINRAKDPLKGAARAINTTVDALVTDAGWHGSAASSFRGAWERDSTVMGTAVDLINDVAQAVTDLAHGLSAARSSLYNAQDVAARAGVPFTKDGQLIPRPLSGKAGGALTVYEAAVTHAKKLAQDARDTAKTKLYAVLVRTDPDLPGGTELLSAQDDAALAALVHDYVYEPQDFAKLQLNGKIKDIEGYYADLKAQKGHGTQAVKKQIRAEMAETRKNLRDLRGDVKSVSFYEDEIKKGKYFNTSLGSVLEKLGGKGKWIRIADQVPVFDVAAVTLGTYAQAKYDHDRGWGWTHSIVADGAANISGVAAEVATAETGPIAPIIGYGATSLINEYTHSTHWSQNIHNDGVVLGVGRSIGEGGYETLKTDFIGMGGKIMDSASDPVGSAKKLWHGVFG
jgi:uncharacterized protein YukE